MKFKDNLRKVRTRSHFSQEKLAEKLDVSKFKVDLNSTEAKKRSDIEQKLGKKVGLQGTPLFRINGETIPATDLTETIKNLLSSRDLH